MDAPEVDPPWELPHTDPPDADSAADSAPDDSDPLPPPPHPAVWTLGDPVVCAVPEARLDRATDTWNPGGAWASQTFDAAAPPLFAGGGVAVADVDADGVLDVFRTSALGGFAWYALAPGGAVDRTAELPPLPSVTSGVVVVDVDGDGDLDLHVLAWQAPDVVVVQEAGTFVARTLGIEGPADEDTIGAAWADVDADGDLDAFVAAYGDITGDVLGDGDAQHLWIRQSDGSFVDLVASLPPAHALRTSHTFLGGFVQLVDDVRPELYVVRDFGVRVASSAYALSGGALVDLGPLGVEATGSSMGLGIGDLDEDGIDDLVVPEAGRVQTYVSEAGGWFESGASLGLVPDRSRGQSVGWGAEVEDLDNDGKEEVVVAWGHLDPSARFGTNGTSQPDAVWRWDGRIYVDVGLSWGLAQRGASRGFVVADLNADGWLDVVKQDLRGPTTIHRARCGEGAWLVVDLRQDGLNAFGVGAEVRVTVGARTWRRTVRAGGTSYASAGPPEVHFGLGAVDVVDRVEIRWPDASTDTMLDVPTRRRVRADRRSP